MIYKDLIITISISIISFIIGIIVTLYTTLKYYIVLNKEGLENTWNLGANIGDTHTFDDSKKQFEEYYEDLKRNP